MKSYTMVITGRTSLPSLFHTFDIGSDRMAREYATRQALLIASEKYYHFALFYQAEDQQEMLAEWDVKLTPTLIQGGRQQQG